MAGTQVTMETASDHSQVTMKTTGIAKTMNHDQKRRCAISCPSAFTQPLFCKIKARNFVSKKNDKAKCHKTKQNNDGRQPSIKIKIPKRNTKTNPTEAQVREAIAKMVAKKMANVNTSKKKTAAQKTVQQADSESSDAEAQVREAIAKLVADKMANVNASKKKTAAQKTVQQADSESSDADDESELDAIQAIKMRRRRDGNAGQKEV